MKKISAEQIAIWGDKAIARVLAIFPTVKDVRRDLMNPFIEHIQLRSKYNKHTNTENKHKLQNWVIHRNGGTSQTFNYDPMPEIQAKGLQKVYDALQNTALKDFADVRYFDKTEHQTPEPMRFTVADFQIDFGGVGTKWCGGRGGNGYVFQRYVDNNQQGNWKQIAVISPELSKYFAELANRLIK